jgi:hypothetical protein
LLFVVFFYPFGGAAKYAYIVPAYPLQGGVNFLRVYQQAVAGIEPVEFMGVMAQGVLAAGLYVVYDFLYRVGDLRVRFGLTLPNLLQVTVQAHVHTSLIKKSPMQANFA